MTGFPRLFVLTATVAAAVLGPAAAASADVVSSPIGTVEASQYLGNYCDDLGTHVRVTISNGLPGTTYTITSSGPWTTTKALQTDTSGAGVTDLHSVRTPGGNRVGTAIITVSAAGTTISVPAQINCPGNKGD